jgi:NaMN:DMB phosphoribosyltransferase
MHDGDDVLGIPVILETSRGRAARIRMIRAPLNIRALGDQALVAVVALALAVRAFVAGGVRAARALVAQAFVTEGFSTWAVRALVRRARTGQEGVLDGSRGSWHR